MRTAYDDFIDGFTILKKYETYGALAKSSDGYEILAGEILPDAMTEEDQGRMAAAGWRWDEGQECWAHSID